MTLPRLFFIALAITTACFNEASAKPTLYLIGDSTVKNGTPGQVGWGAPFCEWFDQSRIRVQNRALGGRSSRSYLREGLWQTVLADLQPGDFVLIQFGHNDNGPLDQGKARASLKGNTDETREVTIQETQAKEVVHSYGAYLRRYIADAQAKGATPIVCSLVPRNIWKDGKVVRSAGDYCKWAREAVEQGGALFIDLNELIAQRYETDGQDNVRTRYFTSDHTHTSAIGAEINAASVVEGLRLLRDCPLTGYLLEKPSIAAAEPTASN